MSVLADFEKAASICKDLYGDAFFACGGCGVLAAILAETAQNRGESGSFLMIMREEEIDEDEDGECERWLSHICFFHNASNDSYDLGGSDAEDRWVTGVESMCRELGENEPCFCTEDIEFDSSQDISDLLKKISDDYRLSITSKWAEDNYANLRDKVLSSIYSDNKVA